jgi:hypothetical protein
METLPHMKPKMNTTVIRTPCADCWIAKNILYVASTHEKKTRKQIAEHYTILKGIARNKMFIIVDLSIYSNYDESMSTLIHHEMAKICKALAIITPKAFESMVATYMSLSNEGIPVRLFENERAAKTWLRILVREEEIIKKEVKRF